MRKISMRKWIVVAGIASVMLTSCKTQEVAVQKEPAKSAKPTKSTEPAKPAKEKKIKQAAPQEVATAESDIPKAKANNFKKLDKDEDGKLSLEEFTVTVKRSFEKKGDTSEAYKAEAQKRFKRRDQNQDGSLSLVEFATPPGSKKAKK